MTEQQYDQFIAGIAKNIVWMNEDACVYSQHVDAVAEISTAIVQLEQAGRAWRGNVEKAISRELVERDIITA